MKFKFWGVRGSLPMPGPHTVRYGGNTTCIEVRSDAGTLVVIDAGTGIYGLGQQLRDAAPATVHLLLSHSHWDHIHGLPFFAPLYRRGGAVSFYGVRDSATGQGIEHVLQVQLQPSYFPVTETELGATLAYRTVAAGERFAVGDIEVSSALMSHPVSDLGYRLGCDGKSLFFTGDHEPFHNPHRPGHPDHAALARDIAARERAIEDCARGVDALIADCSYTREEAPGKLGWGHGNFDSAIALAIACGARHLYCTHHEPSRGDAALEAVFADVMARHGPLPGGLQIHLAAEGLEIQL